MVHSSTVPPGYTSAEKLLLQSMVDEVHSFISAADWERRLPVAVSRSYVMERLGNPVQLTLRLYQHLSKARNQEEVKLRLDVNIQGTGKEKWRAAEGGFFLSHGLAAEVADDVRSFHADIAPIQAKLADDYRGTFYNS